VSGAADPSAADRAFAKPPTACASQPPEARLPAALEKLYRHAVAVHADDPATGVCGICRRRRCPEWAYAMEQWILAGL
jgi:hypothetical protein